MRPNLVIIGAQKCGTSALHYYLKQHPDISMSQPKELDFFMEARNWGRGVGWYEKHWREDTLVRGEASPNYTSYPNHLGVPERMASVVPDAKLIYLVRDPISRLTSQYMHHYALRREHRDFRTAVLDPNMSYLNRSRYMFQLEQFLGYYDRKNILVMDSGDLRDDRVAALQRVFTFLGVDDRFTSDLFEVEKHKTSEKMRLNAFGAWARRQLPGFVFRRMQRRLPLGRPIERPRVDDDLRQTLVQLIKEDADRFRIFTGNCFSHWQL